MNNSIAYAFCQVLHKRFFMVLYLLQKRILHGYATVAHMRTVRYYSYAPV